MTIASVAHWLRLEGLARGRWRVEDAAGLALFAFPRVDTAEDDSGEDQSGPENRAQDNTRDGATRKSRRPPCARSCATRRRRTTGASREKWRH